MPTNMADNGRSLAIFMVNWSWFVIFWSWQLGCGVSASQARHQPADQLITTVLNHCSTTSHCQWLSVIWFTILHEQPLMERPSSTTWNQRFFQHETSRSLKNHSTSRRVNKSPCLCSRRTKLRAARSVMLAADPHCHELINFQNLSDGNYGYWPWSEVYSKNGKWSE